MSPFLMPFNGRADKLIYSRKSWLVVLLPFLLLFFSCNKKNTDTGEYSKAFIPVFQETSHYFETNKPEEGLRYLNQAFGKISYPTINDRFRYLAFHYVYYQKVKGDSKKGLLYADSMMALAEKSVTKYQYTSNFAEANYAKGDSYFSLRQFNDAYQCYFHGYMVARNNLNPASLADYTYRMGMIMYKQERYSLAANYFKESYKQSASIKDDFPEFYRKQELLDNIAISLRHNGDIDSSLAYFDKALGYINANEQKFKSRASMLEMARGVIYGNKAEAFIIKKQYPEAMDLLKKSIAINLNKSGDEQDAEFTEMKLAQLYFITHQNDSLVAVLKNVRGQLDSVKNQDAETDWNKLMGDYYLQKKNPVKALAYIQNYNSLKDSTIKRLSSLKESDVNQQLANFEKQYEIDNLNNNNKLQRIYRNVAIICAVMAVAIILLVWRNWRSSKHDVITVKMLNEEINQQKSSLEKALDDLKNHGREKDRILRTVAHDLRNPLGGIASLTSIMVDEAEHDTELQYQLKIIKDTSSDTLELINEILEATSNSTGNLNKQLVEINSLLNNSIELLRFKAAEKHQNIILEGLDTQEQLYINREMIWRVISNIISNAIKFSPVDAVINVKCIQRDLNVTISIKDHGIGIPDELKDKVFLMFTDAKRPGTIGEKSFGLGLSICKQIVEKHNGKIWFESAPKKGTTFFIRLPKPKKMDLVAIDQHSELREQN